jgi:carbon monoxide dehydrogenase subunit G
MEFNGDHEFNADRQKVYDAFFNADVLKAAIPGCKKAAWADPETLYVEADINFLVIKGDYAGQIKVTEQQKPSHFKMSITYRSVQASATIDLAEKGGKTELTYKGEATLSGAFKAADNFAGAQAAKMTLGSFFKSVEKQITG